MTWESHTPHKQSTDSKQFYTYTLMDKDGEPFYAAYIIHNDSGYQATVPNPPEVMPRGKVSTPAYHYTHDTLQEAKDWCIAELWKRRLDQ